jgi:hypothetical protein
MSFNLTGSNINQMVPPEIFLLFVHSLLDITPPITHCNILMNLKRVCKSWKYQIESTTSLYHSVLLNSFPRPLLSSFGPVPIDLAWCMSMPIADTWGPIAQWKHSPMSFQVISNSTFTFIIYSFNFSGQCTQTTPLLPSSHCQNPQSQLFLTH